MSSFHSRAATWKLTTPGSRVGEVGELVVVRGEQRLRPRARVGRQVLGDRPGDAQAVEGRRAAADLVEDDEAARRRACAGCCAVSCISTMNVDWPRAMLSDAPTRAKMRSTIGSFASRAGTNEPACASSAEQRRLPQVGRLAAHVRAGQDHQLARRAVERDVVRHERVAPRSRSTTGCRASATTSSSPSCTCGLM